MPHSWPCTGAATPCDEQRASNRLRAGQLTWCHVKDSRRCSSSWRLTCQRRQPMIGSVWSLTRRLRLGSSRNRLFDRLFRRRRDRLLERRYLDFVLCLGRSDFQRSLLSSRGRRTWSDISLIGISRQTLQRGVDVAGRGPGRDAAATGTVGFLQAQLGVADHAHESMTFRFRYLLLGALTALALLAAGCGGATTSGSGGASGATLVRPDALVFVSFDTDLGSSQWKQVDALSKKF